MNLEVFDIELLELFYKKYTHTVQASDYVEWAKEHLHMDILEIKKLASMSVEDSLNIFEIEKMFADIMEALQQAPPSEKECFLFHVKSLHKQLLLPSKTAISIVKELYDCTIEHDLMDEQLNWQEISDAIDDFQYGDNQNGYTEEKIKKMIIPQARKLWHGKLSNVECKEIIGQKITGIDYDVHFIIQLEKGAIIIECPWRIRNVDSVLLGETDIKSNQIEWKAVKELLKGKTIEDVHIFEQCPFLIIQCDDLFLDVFHASSHFDGWTLTDEDGFYLFSMYGGSLA